VVPSRRAAVAVLVAGLVTVSTPPLVAFQSPPPTEWIESAVADIFSPERERRLRAYEVLTATPAASTPFLIASFSARPRDERVRLVSFLLSPAMADAGLAGLERLGAPAAPSLVHIAMEREPDDADGSLIQGQRDAYLLRLLRSQGQAASAALRPFLSSEAFPQSRAKAIELTYELRDPATLAIASEAIGDAEPKVRRAAVNVLGRAGSAAEVPAILSMAGDRDEGVRKAVHKSLVLLGPQAIAPLEAAVAGGPTPANVAAVRVLSGLGPPGIAALQRARPASIPPLLVALRKHSSKEVTAAVHEVAAPEAVAHLLAAFPEEVHLAPRDEGPLAVDLLVQLLEMAPSATDPRPLDAASAWPALLAYLQDRCNPSRFVPAAKVLAMIREARAVDALASGLRGYECGPGWSHGNVPVAEAAAIALGGIGDPRAIPPLVEVVEDTDLDPITRRAAASSLRRLGDPAGIAAAERYLAAPHSKRSVVKRRLAVLVVILVLASVVAAVAVRMGSGLVSHRLFLLVCAGTGWFAGLPAVNSTPPDIPLIGAVLAVLWAIGWVMGYWFGRPGSASPFLSASGRELARGVGAALVGVLLLIPFEILLFLLFIMDPRHP
jgi:HEAT repeat protein